jgi:hypothetical protein
MQKINVEIQSDLIEKFSKSDPIPALSELVWNGVDADADKVSIFLEHDNLDVLDRISVRDNGTGFSPEEAAILFKNLGGSWKRLSQQTKIKKRDLHGKEGRGRFKVFALGRVAVWNIVYKKNKQFFEYKITIFRDNIRQAEISEQKISKSKNSGVTVEISELDKNFKSLTKENATQSIAESFALYLKNYTDVEIIYDGVKVDPSLVIDCEYKYPLSTVKDENGTEHSTELEIIEWKVPTKKALYLCNSKGFPYSQAKEKRFHTGKYEFSAYLKSSFIEQLYQENTLEMGELKKELVTLIEEAQSVIKNHFLDKAADEAQTVVEEWKKEKIYPFEQAPTNSIEKVERQIFDIVAVKINTHLSDFSISSPNNKKLSLKLLKQSIEKSPEDLQLILNEVLNLPKRQQKELADLLRDTTLTAIINASKLISDRLKFIAGLEEIVFDTELKKHLKERSQLHQILKDNTWFFGEEFNLSVSDQSLTEVLKKHKKQLGEDITIDKPVKRIDGSTGIVDLMLSRKIKTNRADELEHLIIELKAPKVPIKQTETGQIETYAFAVANDERFRGIKTRWTFWLISNDMDDVVKYKTKQNNRPEGILHQSDATQNPHVIIWVKTWSQIILENKARLSFIKEKLEFEADNGKSLKMLQEMYSHLLSGTEIEEKIEEKINQYD